MSDNSQRFFGKYRGKVSDNKDPLKLGRIRAKVPVLFGEEDLNWALPCAPYAGKGVGFFCVPPVDAVVWIEFESGNLQKPIWSGGFWVSGDTPDESASPDIKILKTASATIKVDDTSGSESITLETTSGLKIVLDQDGIELSNGSQKIKIGSSSISLNDGALEVT
jgi:uncharacterized protein involved in type VI secretion and phage assembly